MSKYLLSALLICASSTSAFATVTVSSTAYGVTAPAGSSAVVDFDNALPKGFTLSGGAIQQGNNASGAAPAFDSTKYLTANAGNPAILMSTIGYNTVSFYWGSMDTYNTIDLLDKAGKTFASYTGWTVYTPANGNRTNQDTNRRVQFDISGATSPIYGLKFESGAPAFEADNVAFSSPVPMGAVPESATWGMMIGGLGMVGSSLRRIKKSGMQKLALA